MEDDTLSGRLKHVRVNILSESQDAFARRVSEGGYEVTAVSVGRYEKGERDKVPAEYVRAVAEVTGIDAGLLLTGRNAAGVDVPSALRLIAEMRVGLDRLEAAMGGRGEAQAGTERGGEQPDDLPLSELKKDSETAFRLAEDADGKQRSGEG